MSIGILLDDLRRRGVGLTLEGEDIKLRARKGVVTDVDKERVAASKAAILATLRAETPSTRVIAPQPPPTPPVRATDLDAPTTSAGSAIDLTSAGNTPPRRSGTSSLAAVPSSDLGTSSHKSQKSPQTARVAAGRNVPATDDDHDRPEIESTEPIRGSASVTIGGRVHPYFVWGGQRLAGDYLGFDTETALIVDDEVPRLALGGASSGDQHCLIHPDRIGEFIRHHRDRHFVFHNVAFDYWVVAEHLASRGESEALEAWRGIADDDRMHDTMILDQLIRLARTDAHPRPRNLAEVAGEYAGLEVDKLDPFRLRYGEIIGRDWDFVERGFFEYAIKDPIVTLAAYERMSKQAITLMEAHGHGPVRRV